MLESRPLVSHFPGVCIPTPSSPPGGAPLDADAPVGYPSSFGPYSASSEWGQPADPYRPFSRGVADNHLRWVLECARLEGTSSVWRWALSSRSESAQAYGRW